MPSGFPGETTYYGVALPQIEITENLKNISAALNAVQSKETLRRQEKMDLETHNSCYLQQMLSLGTKPNLWSDYSFN